MFVDLFLCGAFDVFTGYWERQKCNIISLRAIINPEERTTWQAEAR